MDTPSRSLRRRGAFIVVDPATHQPTSYYPTGGIQTDDLYDQRSSLDSNSQEIERRESFRSPAFPTTPSEAYYPTSSPHQDQRHGTHQGSTSRNGLDRRYLDGALNALDNAMEEVSMGHMIRYGRVPDRRGSFHAVDNPISASTAHIQQTTYEPRGRRSLFESPKSYSERSSYDDHLEGPLSNIGRSLGFVSPMRPSPPVYYGEVSEHYGLYHRNQSRHAQSAEIGYSEEEEGLRRRNRRDTPYDSSGPVYNTRRPYY